MLVLILLDVVGEAVVFVLALTRGHCTPQGPCVETSTGGAESTGRFITQARREIKKNRREEEGVVSLRVEEIRILESRGLVKVERGLGQLEARARFSSERPLLRAVPRGLADGPDRCCTWREGVACAMRWSLSRVFGSSKE
ncbi:hypothetical protein BC826DRAFT_1179173 [Russula brevipes]|nr:hypothetical protein BC826DRAFT_1179173 [Russula brevipes]